MNKQRQSPAPRLVIVLASLLTGLLLVPWTVVRAEQLKDLYEMEVLGVTVAQGGDQTAVLLRSKGAKRELTLFVGPFEAQSIAVPLQQMKPLRPLTHDLTLSLLAAFRSHLGRVIISDFKDNTYFATLYIETDGKEITVDSRPSDAIALALRAGAPIYASSKALDGASANRSLR
ncbi:MAG TPA: bifunctional nuclease family protein [Patescibacteria group bacterium]|nr:bifunctional nuclease family protein [Patescibacteria group bacterium]